MNNSFNYIIILLTFVTFFVTFILFSNYLFRIIVIRVNRIKYSKPIKRDPKFSVFDFFFERVFDLFITITIFLFFLSWVMPFIAVLIKLTSYGPIMYRQRIYGLNGKMFYTVKFRTIYFREGEQSDFPSTSTPKLTPVGAILQKTGLHMLPSWMNVLMGHMTVVGRSNILNYKSKRELLSEEEIMTLSKIKPGIFSLYSISKDATELNSNDVSKFDLYYCYNRSIILNLKILIASVIISYGLPSKY